MIDTPDGRSVILYGDSGNGKSSAVYWVARGLWERTGKPVRVLSFEDSSKLVFAPLIAAGAVDYLALDGVASPAVAMRELREGAWRAGDVRLAREDWAGSVSGYIIEGLTTASEAILMECQRDQRFLREQKADAFTIGAHKFAPASQSAYGFTQLEALAAVRRFAALPVEMVVWTAHEVGATDEANGLIRGPQLVGTAKTKRVQAYVGTVLHLDRGKNGGRVCWFEDHPDPNVIGARCPAKVTLPPEAAMQLRRDLPAASFPVTLDGAEVAKFLFSLRDRAFAAPALAQT